MTPDELLPQVYDEIRKLAASKMAREQSDHTLDATALVHEAYLKLDGERSFESKSHFLRAADAWWSYARAWLSVELGK